MFAGVRLRLLVRAKELGKRALHDPPPSWGAHGWNGPPPKAQTMQPPPMYFAAENRAAADTLLAETILMRTAGNVVAQESAVVAAVFEGAEAHTLVTAEIVAEDA